MKHFVLFLAILTACAVHAQTKYPEPDFANVPMWYDASSQTLKSFERTPPNTATRMTGIASAESLIFFPNETSSVQFPLGKVPAFIVKMAAPTDDPTGTVELGKLQVNKRKHQREYIAAKGGMGGSKTTVSTLVVDFRKVKDGMFEIVPSAPLEAGEYAFNVGKKGFLFSVTDPNGSRGALDAPQNDHRPHDPLANFIYKKMDEKKARDKEKQATAIR